jgi:hypothetical protein
MADTQSNVYAQAYAANIMQLAQQKYSKLLSTVYIKPNVKGKTFFQDQIGKWSMSTKGGRNVQTPNNDPNLGRRMGTLVDYHDNRMLDRGDELRMISDPRSAYTIAAASALGRQIDTVIANQMSAIAKSGETGSTNVTLGTTSIAAHVDPTPNITTQGTAATLTFQRVRNTKRVLDLEDVEAEDRFFAVSPHAMDQLLNTTQATSSDYAAVKALVRGEIDTWMGFKWIVSTNLSSSGTVTSCMAFNRYALCMAMGSEPLVRTDERTDLSYSWQVYYELNIGAVRLEEARVVLVNCTSE